ncbi:MAG: hypothetical protein MHPSP_002183, partial [Paramarteilia canceri]
FQPEVEWNALGKPKINFLDVVELIVELEDLQQIAFSDSEIQNIKTMNDLVDKVVEKKLGLN